MRVSVVIFGVLLAALSSGCGYRTEVGEVERTDLSQVDEGVTQLRIEEGLGPPVASEDLEVGQLNIYAYDTGRSGEKVGISQGLGGFNPGVYVVFGIMAASKSLGAPPRDEQRGHLAVLYNSRNEAKWIWKGGRIGPDQALQDSQADLTKLLERETIACEAPDGTLSMAAPRQCLEGEGAPVTWGDYGLPSPRPQDDPETMYQYAVEMDLGAGLERLKWYCLAAHAGHAQARNQFGRYNNHGWVTEVDLVQAYVWYTLSLEVEDSSNVAKQREQLFKKMTPAQIAEAERLVAEWEPNPEECEEYTEQANN